MGRGAERSEAERAFMTPTITKPDGRIADSILYFGRTLRKAGMRVRACICPRCH